MAVSSATPPLWDSVLELTKGAQDNGSDPLIWTIHLSSTLSSSGVSLPSIDLSHVLVSHICWGNNVPMAWKYLERAVAAKIAPPMLVLALLSLRVIPCRRSRPAAYRLYMELLKRHAFSFAYQITGPNNQKIITSVGDVLNLSQIFGVQACEPGVLVVEFVFSIIWQLLDATLDDEGLLELIPEKKSRWPTRPQDMEIDGENNFDEKRSENHDKLQKVNMVMAIELIGQFLQHKIISRLLYLARQNMPSHWGAFMQRLRLLASNSSALRNSTISPENLLQLSSSYVPKHFGPECRLSQYKEHRSVIASGSLAYFAGHYYGVNRSALWIPLDMFLEDCMDYTQVAALGAIEILTGLIKALHTINGTNWHDSFLGTWMAALRLVQRERDPIEGPVPRLDTRLCLLLSITTLSIANIIEEEEAELIEEMERGATNQWKEKQVVGKRRKDLVSSLQALGDYGSLLTPPQSVISVANQAAAKAMSFVPGVSVGSGYYECISMNDMPMNCSGNMRHLIVEACIARNLLDTSAYFWPGYVNRRNQIPHGMPGQVPVWSTLKKPLTPSMINALVTTPASSLTELEKVFDIAVNGSDDEKASAATILCGASLLRGWNIQEHTVRFVMKLLSLPVPADYSGTDSHMISNAPLLNSLLVGISSVDSVQIFSLQGLVPELAGALMAICEVFGSSVPNVSWTLPTGEEITAHSVFSNAFILLLRLWKFNHPPLEHHVMGNGAPVGSQLTPEYLLLLRNSQVASSNNTPKDRNSSRRPPKIATSASMNPIFVDSFPRLKVWYRQHQACIASPLTGLVPGTPVHQIVDGLLNMIFRKMNKGSQSVTSGSSVSSSSGPTSDDASLRPKLPAWDILEAVPFVVDAALTACSHGRLSPRELATGLKDLADFLPASLATIVSYFSAEVTRGVWKPAFMNGTDWPSPAANLSTVEEHIKKILAATGVIVPSLSAGASSPATLPLPLAAFVSLTITYKLDKGSERFLNLAGPALESLAAGCPWPSMPIVASLWAQKVKRWNDFLTFSASRTVFQQNIDAVLQLLKSCFSATLDLSPAHISSNGGVGGLLGPGFGSHFTGGFSPVEPGILYLRIYRSVRDIMFVTEKILDLLMHSVKVIAAGSGPQGEQVDKLKKSKFGTKYGQVSLAAAMTRVKLVAMVAASLLWLSGGSGLVQTLFQETIPSWFLSVHRSDQEVGGGMAATLGGYALAYFAVLCGAFAWSMDSVSATKRRPRIIRAHTEFLAGAIDGKITLGCEWATWRAYVSGFVGLMVGCMPTWVADVEVDVLRRLSKGLRQWNEEELALALLVGGGIGALGAAAELIITGN
ncbi:mediator of RNA polymerase II transcription subunit 33A-like [Magnolia sinica]|uniref:mediator of RNA polymerase II transcription subunit 33A-like n=1 Tax=Magnolia sinica TaxID=86752 RepID=UPI0026593E41|nr:mediator of RNA polymerase II transcription subunit 33A-like [Magnolia sinica]